jgi:hypothetical protein
MPYVLRYSQYWSYASLGFFVALFVVSFVIAQVLKRYIRYRSFNYAVRFLYIFRMRLCLYDLFYHLAWIYLDH